MYSAVRALNPHTVPARLARVLRGDERPDLRRDELLCEIFVATARARPDAIALITAGGRLTYAEVERRAAALARGLLRQGIGPGRVVGLWLPRGCELLISQIAIAMTGAAWLPFDADAPIDRIAACLEDAHASALLSGGPRAETARARPACPVFTAEDLVNPADQSPVDARALGATPDHPAYLIYTSGSTGTPKGIAVSGRNICHYLRAANEVYKVGASDIVFQGASVAFDLSMEEIWLPYLVGATLFVASPEIMGETDRLPDVLEANGVTVLDTVPTLLSVLPRDVGSLRLIILGGEACPPTLARQWCRPGRKIYNSYGPTEATVVATIAEVRIGEPVTIGTPIPNYSCYVVDENLGLLGVGEEGELLIGGPGVAQGYLNRPQLTAEKFIENPFGGQGDPVLYRSGDAAIIDQNGNLLFRGRIDDQVKIRGFRVELGEIEAHLRECAGIDNAAVVLRQHDGIDELTAFVVATPGARLDSKLLRSELRAKLPAYMVPARFELLAALPTLVSGKVDRNSLKKLELVPLAEVEAQEAPRNETEAVLLAAAKRVLPPQPIPLDADFFTDLGGHSLLAARFVSIVRETRALAGITLQDVYQARSMRAIAALMNGKSQPAGGGEDLSFTPPPFLRRFLCGLAQLAAMPVILSLIAVQWLGVFMSYMLFTDADATIFDEIAVLVAVYVAIELAILAIAIGAKWLLLGRTKPGRYPLWGTYFYRWWLAERLLSLIQIKMFQGTPIARFYLRALGARIGKDVIIGDLSCGAHDLISIGDRACLGANTTLANARVEGNELVIGEIAIGADVQIGSSCSIEEGVTIGEGAELLDLTAAPAGTRIGAWEIWDGSPARRTGTVNRAELLPFAAAGGLRKGAMATIYALLLLAVPPLSLIPIFAGFWAFNRVDDLIGVADIEHLLYFASIPVMSWPTAFVMVLVTVGFIIAFRWAILPRRVSEGAYSVHSWFYLRKWAVGLASEATLDTLSSLYATVYMRLWYRLMGAKIGKGAEISTNFAGRYDLVEIGEKCFIADEVVLGDEEIRRGYMILKKVKTGPRVFVGNSAVVPSGAEIPANALIGIKSKPPANELMGRGDTWFGSPPIKLPVRQTFDVGGAWTYEPPWWKKLARAGFEAVTISLPVMLFITFGTWAVNWFADALLGGAYGEFAWRFVASAVGISVALCAVVVALKWITMGRYEPVTKPMWSWWAMRTEAVAVIYAGLAGRMLLEHLRGTPFLPWVWRLLGVKVGRGVFADMTDITEFDCVSIGDFSALNMNSALQTHLYEDRVMKVGRVNVGRGVTVGAGSTVLYDTVVGDYARLGPLTVVMKGEHIPEQSEWIGSPAQVKAAVAIAEEKAAA